MNWKNLKDEKCPKCGAYLNKDKLYYCNFCGFKMHLGKVFSITGKIKTL